MVAAIAQRFFNKVTERGAKLRSTYEPRLRAYINELTPRGIALRVLPVLIVGVWIATGAIPSSSAEPVHKVEKPAPTVKVGERLPIQIQSSLPPSTRKIALEAAASLEEDTLVLPLIYTGSSDAEFTLFWDGKIQQIGSERRVTLRLVSAYGGEQPAVQHTSVAFALDSVKAAAQGQPVSIEVNIGYYNELLHYYPAPVRYEPVGSEPVAERLNDKAQRNVAF